MPGIYLTPKALQELYAKTQAFYPEGDVLFDTLGMENPLTPFSAISGGHWRITKQRVLFGPAAICHVGGTSLINELWVPFYDTIPHRPKTLLEVWWGFNAIAGSGAFDVVFAVERNSTLSPGSARAAVGFRKSTNAWRYLSGGNWVFSNTDISQIIPAASDDVYWNYTKMLCNFRTLKLLEAYNNGVDVLNGEKDMMTVFDGAAANSLIPIIGSSGSLGDPGGYPIIFARMRFSIKE